MCSLLHMLILPILFLAVLPGSATQLFGGTTLSSSVLLLVLFASSDATSQATADVTGDRSVSVEQETEAQISESSTAETMGSNVDCGLWLAASTLVGAGIGMFAGRDFQKDEMMQQSGDVVVPIVDIRYHQVRDNAPDIKFLWDEYTWNADYLDAGHEGYSDLNLASPGFGSAANSFLPLLNVDEWNPQYRPLGFHRSKDPGSGAFSFYGNRTTTASRDIQAGEELFVSYGEEWFIGREYLGPIPLTDDLKRASKLFAAFKEMRDKIKVSLANDALAELWQIFVQSTSFSDSRVFGAFNHSDPAELQALEDKDMTQIRLERSARSMEWLQQHGTCADHIKGGRSTIDQAGNGAFSTRFLSEGTLVAHLPLIHIPKRQIFEMYHFDEPASGEKPIPNPRKGISGYQLLLNYCMGHRSSTLLLCPYGPMVNYINHNQTLANVKLQWADPERGNHKPEALNFTVYRLERDFSAKLAMELVATRDIEEGEEVFMDYGTEWEEAWNDHVSKWKPGMDGHIAAYQLNEDVTRPMRTEFELLSDLPNVHLWCTNNFLGKRWQGYYQASNLVSFMENYPGTQYRCDLLRYRRGDDGNYFYTAVLWSGDAEHDDPPEFVGKLEDVPKEAFKYYDLPYTSDMLHENAFRHDIRLPDEMFPVAWKNLEGEERR